MLSPFLSKNACGPTLTTTSRSPGAPPKRPASPIAGIRIRVPVVAPAGTSTSSLSIPEARPSPRQLGHEVTTRPEPPQSPQVTANCRWPFTRVVLPDPPHGEHAVSREPGARPVPSQAAHRCIRVTETLVRTPQIDSSKLIEMGYSKS